MEKFHKTIMGHVKHVCFFKFIKKNSLLSYVDNFLLAGIVKYMRAQVGPSSKDLLSLDKYEAFLKVQESAIVGFFEKETDLKTTFLKYADKQREKHRFGHSSDPAVLDKIGEK